jgi:hypothetical protein
VTELGALKQALAAEQAVIYGYGVAGAHLSGKDRKLASSRLVAHETLRDQLSARISALGAVPPAALPAYRLPAPVTDAVTARQLAAHLEEGAAGRAWDLVAATAPRSESRGLAVAWLTDAAVSAAHWGSPSVALPGRPT